MDIVKLDKINNDIRDLSDQIYTLVDRYEIFQQAGREALAKICKDRIETLTNKVSSLGEEFESLSKGYFQNK